MKRGEVEKSLKEVEELLGNDRELPDAVELAIRKLLNLIEGKQRGHVSQNLSFDELVNPKIDDSRMVI